MKTKIALIIICFAGLVVGQPGYLYESRVIDGELATGSYVISVIGSEPLADPNNPVEHIVRYLAEKGEICKVFGHNWRGGRPGEGNGIMFADYHPNTEYRTCKICGKCESQNTNDWN